jgi:hypothetical protein
MTALAVSVHLAFGALSPGEGGGVRVHREAETALGGPAVTYQRF